MRHLGIDYGLRRIGLALSDEGGTLATPLQVLAVRAPAAAIGTIAQVARDHGVGRLVVGLPLNMDASEGPAAAAVRSWAGSLAAETGLAVIFVDERLSSFEAEQTIRQRKQAGEKITRRGRKGRLDAVVAAQLLQAYLDGALLPL